MIGKNDGRRLFVHVHHCGLILVKRGSCQLVIYILLFKIRDNKKD